MLASLGGGSRASSHHEAVLRAVACGGDGRMIPRSSSSGVDGNTCCELQSSTSGTPHAVTDSCSPTAAPINHWTLLSTVLTPRSPRLTFRDALWRSPRSCWSVPCAGVHSARCSPSPYASTSAINCSGGRPVTVSPATVARSIAGGIRGRPGTGSTPRRPRSSRRRGILHRWWVFGSWSSSRDSLR